MRSDGQTQVKVGAEHRLDRINLEPIVFAILLDITCDCIANFNHAKPGCFGVCPTSVISWIIRPAPGVFAVLMSVAGSYGRNKLVFTVGRESVSDHDSSANGCRNASRCRTSIRIQNKYRYPRLPICPTQTKPMMNYR